MKRTELLNGARYPSLMSVELPLLLSIKEKEKDIIYYIKHRYLFCEVFCDVYVCSLTSNLCFLHLPTKTNYM